MNRFAHLLSSREREVMVGTVDGLGISELAQILRVSPKTISEFRHRVVIKLEARNTTHAAAIWARGEAPAPARVMLMADEVVRMATDIALDRVRRPVKI